MSEPELGHDYHERDVRAAYAVLIEIGQVLGAWREKFVIVTSRQTKGEIQAQGGWRWRLERSLPLPPAQFMPGLNSFQDHRTTAPCFRYP